MIITLAKNPFTQFIQMFFIQASIGYFIGLLLPDSDSENKGSKIFHTALRPIALMCNWIERKKAHKHGYSLGHRKFLHSPIGILYTSLVPAGVTAIAFFIFYNNILVLLTTFVATYVGAVVGQFVHLIQDTF